MGKNVSKWGVEVEEGKTSLENCSEFSVFFLEEKKKGKREEIKEEEREMIYIFHYPIRWRYII